MREITDAPSANHDARSAAIDMLVLHYTGMETACAAIDRLRDPASKVSAHYVVGEDGTVLRLVAEERRAWHAGVSYWRGNRDINARSLGIEIVNPGHEFGYRPFPPAQMAAVVELSLDLVRRYGIPAWNVVGHADIAPRRKSDPGELFEWALLARCGVGLWASQAAVAGCGGTMDVAGAAGLLSEIGYETDDLHATLTAFQRRFRPGLVDGRLDSATADLLRAVRGLYP